MHITHCVTSLVATEPKPHISFLPKAKAQRVGWVGKKPYSQVKSQVVRCFKSPPILPSPILGLQQTTHQEEGEPKFMPLQPPSPLAGHMT